MKATKSQLRKEIKDLRKIGLQFSNVAYNITQNNTLDYVTKGILKNLQIEYDKIDKSE